MAKQLFIFKNWQRLVIGLIMIHLFIFVIVPKITQNQKSTQMRHFIEENNIDANALFYTESEKAGEAAFYFSKKDLDKE